MKNLITGIVLLFTLILVSIFYGCSKDENPVSNPVNPTPTSMQGNWKLDKIQMVSAPSSGGLSSVMKSALVPFGLMSTSNVGWLNATIGGVKWNLQTSGGSNSYNKIQFLDNQTGWVGSTYSFSSPELRSTTNGGITWNTYLLPNPSSSGNRPFHFVSSAIGYLSSYNNNNNNNSIYKTTNGGGNWSLVSNVNNTPNDIYFLNEQTGFYTGYNSLYKTTNSGLNWVSIPMGMNTGFIIKFADNLTGWVFGYDNNYQAIIRKTVDGGTTWTDISVSGLYSLEHISVVNSQLLW